MKKKLIIAGAVATLGMAGIGATTYAAQTTSKDSMIDALSQRFKLDKTEVQKFFNEQRATKQAERETHVKDELVQLVKDGKLTQEQSDKITTKRNEIQKEREANKSTAGTEKTDDEREKEKATRDSRRTELESWFKENNIDTAYMRYVMGHGGPGRHGHK